MRRQLRQVGVVLSALLLMGVAASHPAMRDEPALEALPALPEIRQGDVIFFSAPDAYWASLASRWSEPRYRHGHVGLAIIRKGQIHVVHAKGNPVQRKAMVVEEPLAVFLREARGVSVFRPLSAAVARGAAARAERFVRTRTPFDSRFSLQSPDQLYCTELIWRALSAGAGFDILPVKSMEGGRPAVFLSDLEHSGHLRLAWRQALPPQPRNPSTKSR